MLAQRMQSLLSPPDARELLDISLIASIAGENAGVAIAPGSPAMPQRHGFMAATSWMMRTG